MNLIVAVDENWAIGSKGELLFRISGDLRRFKELTQNHTVILGHKTLQTFPNAKPLKNRINLVLSKNTDLKIDGAFVFSSVESVLETLKNRHDEVFVIGGQSVYEQFLPLCNNAYVTKIHCKAVYTDSFFPNLDTAKDWVLAQKSETFTENNISFSFCLYKRVDNIEENI